MCISLGNRVSTTVAIASELSLGTPCVTAYAILLLLLLLLSFSLPLLLLAHPLPSQ